MPDEPYAAWLSEQDLDARRRLRQQIVDVKAVVAQRRLAGQDLSGYVTLSIEQAESLDYALERAERVEKELRRAERLGEAVDEVVYEINRMVELRYCPEICQIEWWAQRLCEPAAAPGGKG